MTVTALNTKLRFMPTQGKTIEINQGTAISLSLAVPLIGGIIYLATSLTTVRSHIDFLQTEMQGQKLELKEVQNGYVSKSEMVLQLQNIEDKLSSIEKTLSKK